MILFLIKAIIPWDNKFSAKIPLPLNNKTLLFYFICFGLFFSTKKIINSNETNNKTKQNTPIQLSYHWWRLQLLLLLQKQIHFHYFVYNFNVILRWKKELEIQRKCTSKKQLLKLFSIFLLHFISFCSRSLLIFYQNHFSFIWIFIVVLYNYCVWELYVCVYCVFDQTMINISMLSLYIHPSIHPFFHSFISSAFCIKRKIRECVYLKYLLCSFLWFTALIKILWYIIITKPFSFPF